MAEKVHEKFYQHFGAVEEKKHSGKDGETVFRRTTDLWQD
jgi:hypothetical protein